MKVLNPNIMQRTIELASENVANGGWPFSTIIVKGDEILAEGVNSVHLSCDPSDHAEIQAVRKACKKLGKPNLDGCDVYVVGMPCPMCMTCLILAKPSRIIFAVETSEKDAALSKLPLTQDLYDKLTFPIKDVSFELVHYKDFSADGVKAFRDWNDR